MIYIVCWIHAIYWFNLGGEYIKSVSLFEMPAIFYIAGASQLLAKNKGTIETFINRFKRILVPYYAYVVLWVLVVLCLKGTLPEYSMKTLFGIIVGESFPLAPGQSHIWFIAPYMAISCLFPLQRRLMQTISPFLYLAFLIILFCFITQTSTPALFKHTIFYNIFFIIGYTTYKKWSCRHYWLLTIPLMHLLLFHTGTLVSMQENKFPPTIIFLMFGLLSLPALCYLSSKITIHPSKSSNILNIIIHHWDKNGYVIYLYQSFSYFIVSRCFKIDYAEHSWWIVLCPIILFTANTIFSIPFTVYNDACTHLYNYISGKISILRNR